VFMYSWAQESIYEAGSAIPFDSQRGRRLDRDPEDGSQGHVVESFSDWYLSAARTVNVVR